MSAPHGKCATLRLSRILPLRLLDQRQAKPFGHIHSARVAAGAEIRDLAMVGRIEIDGDGLVDRRALSSRRTLAFSARPECRCRRLCDRNAAAAAGLGDGRFPDGLANSSGLVGKNLMTQSNQAVFGMMEQEVRWNKGPPSLASPSTGITTTGKTSSADIAGWRKGRCRSSGRRSRPAARALGPGAARRDGELQPPGRAEDGRRDVAERAQPVTLADDKRPIWFARRAHDLQLERQRQGADQTRARSMQTSLDAVGATDIFPQENDTNHLAGTARMGDDPQPAW